MATTRSKKPVKKPEGRKKSKLVQIGEEAMRKALLKTLKDSDWNLTATADELDMGGSGNVSRAIKQLGLEEEYKSARIEKIKAS